MAPQLTIIVTTFNLEDYIEQCLDSIAVQTLRDFEVLVVDDGSSDATPELIEAYAQHDSRFVPVLLGQRSPGGVATAANAGLYRAGGDWVGFVDGDDYIEPEMFETLLTAAQRYDTDLAICRYDEVDDSGASRLPADDHRWAEVPAGPYELDAENQHRFIKFIAVPWRKLYRRAVLEQHNIRFPVGDYFYEDNPFHWASVLLSGSIAVVPELLCHHRIARIGQTMGAADERLFGIFAHHGTIRDFLASQDRTDEFGTDLLIWTISQLEWISRRTPPELYRALYERVVPILATYSISRITQALTEGHKGEYGQRLTLAIAKNQYRTYRRLLEGKPDTSNPMVLGIHHLRHSGPRATAKMTGRFLYNQLPQRMARGSRAGSDRTITHGDLMFGLMAIQQQLNQIEERLNALERQDLLQRSQHVVTADEEARV